MRYSEIDEHIKQRHILRDHAQKRKDVLNNTRNKMFQVNKHLMMILALDPNNQYRQHWKTELTGWLNDIAVTLIKGTKNPIKAKNYIQAMWNEPYATVEQKTANHLLAIIAEEKRDVERNNKTVDQLVQEVKNFHIKASTLIENRQPVNQLVNSL